MRAIAAARVLVVGGVLLLSSLGVRMAVPPLGPSGGSLEGGAGIRAAVAEFQEAITAVEEGRGPMAGEAAACQGLQNLEARCTASPLAGIASATPVPGFQNSTAGGARPPGTYLGSLAWDAPEATAVFFGGWNGHEATNETWLFHGGKWANDTDPGNAPPARYGAAMAYDNQTGVNAVVLSGGCNPAGECPMNDTWLFSGGAWHNLTSQIGAAPALSNATMAGWGQNGTILFGGCEGRSCGAQSSITWTFQNSSLCQALHEDPCWSPVPVSGSAPPGLAGVALASWPMAGSLFGSVILYGGYNRTCLTCEIRDSGATWLLSGNVWSNLTSTYFGTPYPSAGRSFASLFWDPLSNALYLYGGVNSSSGATYNQLWATTVYTWDNESTWSLPSPAPKGPAITGVPFGSAAGLRAFLFGGETSSGALPRGMWVFERSIVNQVNVLPNPVEVNATAQFLSNTSGGTFPTVNWTTGDGGQIVGGNGTHEYRTPGTYLARLTAVDSYGVQNTTTVSVSVHTFSLGLSVPSVTDQSLATAFSAAPTNGTAPYNFTWVFSDGTTAYGASVSHTFSRTGLVTVSVTVRDATGTVVSEVADVHVNPSLTASVSAEPRVLDVGVTSRLEISAFNGTPPYTAVWTLPGNHTFVGPNASFRPTVAGLENISVVLTDTVGGVWSGVVGLTVNPALSFIASWSSGSLASGRSVTFSTKIIGGTGPYSYFWEFGDRWTSSVSAPTHTYGGAGTYTVNVWVNDSGGGSYRQTLEVKIPRTSGGLLWQVLALPTIDLVAIVAAIVAVVLAILVLAFRRKGPQPKPSTPREGPTPPRA